MKRVLFALLLPACAPITATWEGDCDYGIEEVLVDLELIQDGSDISGKGTINHLVSNELVSIPVDADGTRDGDEIELELDTNQQTIPNMFIEAILADKETIEGTCEWDEDGVFDLTRQD